MKRVVTGTAGVIVLVTIILVFSMGATAGAEIAQNESRSLDNTTAELNEIPENAKQDMRENVTGVWKYPMEGFMAYIIEPVLYGSTYSGIQGLYLGYSHPTLGPVVGNLGYLTTVGIILYWIYRQIQTIRRGFND